MFEPETKRRRKYAMPWERPKRDGDGEGLFGRGFLKNRFQMPDEGKEISQFQNYFSFKTVRRIQHGIGSNAVLRNRILFVILCLWLFGYILYHWIR